MNTPLTIVEKIISTLLLIIGVLFTYQAITGYTSSYIIYPEDPSSYRISMTTYVSNLLIGNLLIVSSLLFFKKRELGILMYKFTGIMFVLYAINLDLFDMMRYLGFHWNSISFGSFLLMPFGLFIYIYFKGRYDYYKSKFVLPSFIILGIIIFVYIDLFFCDWYYFFHEK